MSTPPFPTLNTKQCNMLIHKNIVNIWYRYTVNCKCHAYEWLQLFRRPIFFARLLTVDSIWKVYIFAENNECLAKTHVFSQETVWTGPETNITQTTITHKNTKLLQANMLQIYWLKCFDHHFFLLIHHLHNISWVTLSKTMESLCLIYYKFISKQKCHRGENFKVGFDIEVRW